VPEYFQGIDNINLAKDPADQIPQFEKYSEFMIMSRAGSGTHLHKDSLDTDFWNAMVVGRKRWWLTPGDVSTGANVKAEAAFRDAWDMEPQLKMQAETWFRNVLPRVRGVPHYHVMQEEDDLLYVPGGWWHQVVAIKDSIQISGNMLHEHAYQRVFNSVCQRSAYHMAYSAMLCRNLQSTRPKWFANSCCPEFLQNPDAFPRAGTVEEKINFV
jgi:ribosomal protein L16 Arg81 hydroxylase